MSPACSGTWLMIGAARWFAAGGVAVVVQRCGLLREAGVQPAEIDLAGAIAAQLAAERAVDDEVLAREGLHAGGDGAGAAFAGDHEGVAGAAQRLRGVPGAHRRIVGSRRRSLASALVVEGRRTPSGCGPWHGADACGGRVA